MKIIKEAFAKGSVVVSVTTLDDLWFLSHVLDKGDKVSAKTVRKIKMGGEGDRKASVVKKTIFIQIDVEKVEFHKYQNSLRVAGKVLEGPDDITRGSFHTINVEEGTAITIEKEQWLKHQVSKIKEATKETFPKVLLCVMDRKEVSFAMLKRYGYEYLSELEGEVQEKAYPLVKKSATFYADIVKRLQEYVARLSIEYIVLASPAFWKEDLMKELEKKAPELKNKVTLATCNATGKNAMNEVLKRDEVRKLLKNERVIKEIALVEDLFSEIGKEGNAVYGLEQTKAAADAGAVKILLVTDELIHELRQQEHYDKLDTVMKAVEQAQGEIHIITTEHDAGEKLQGLTGVAAITRYKLYD